MTSQPFFLMVFSHLLKILRLHFATFRMAAVSRLLMFPSATSSPLVLRRGSKQAVAHLRRRDHGRPRWRPRQPVQHLTAVRPWRGAERNHKSACRGKNHGNVWMSDQCLPQHHVRRTCVEADAVPPGGPVLRRRLGPRRCDVEDEVRGAAPRRLVHRSPFPGQMTRSSGLIWGVGGSVCG